MITRHSKWVCKDGKIATLASMKDSHLVNSYKWLAARPEEIEEVITDGFSPGVGGHWGDVFATEWTKDGFSRREWKAAFERELERRGLDSPQLYSRFKESNIRVLPSSTPRSSPPPYYDPVASQDVL